MYTIVNSNLFIVLDKYISIMHTLYYEKHYELLILVLQNKSPVTGNKESSYCERVSRAHTLSQPM